MELCSNGERFARLEESREGEGDRAKLLLPHGGIVQESSRKLTMESVAADERSPEEGIGARDVGEDKKRVGFGGEFDGGEAA